MDCTPCSNYETYSQINIVRHEEQFVKLDSPFLHQRIIRVSYQNNSLRCLLLKNSLPQGAVISCTLFNLIIHNLVPTIQKIHGVNCLLFTDDVIIFASGSHIPSINVTVT
jgi:hypothetical protein